MLPGESSEPVWKTRIKAEWNHADDRLDVWVILDEYDTDGEAWLGMRVLDESGMWREWITVEGASLGDPTQTIRGVNLPSPSKIPVSPGPGPATPGIPYPPGGGSYWIVAPTTTPPITTAGTFISYPTTTSGTTGISIDPKLYEKHAAAMEKEFLYGKADDPDASE